MSNKIPSFTIDHTQLNPGLYVSRKDRVGEEVITTFDLRITAPNKEPVMGTAEMHTIEHLAATYLRNHKVWADSIIYFGPMGCRTGFYLIVAGDLHSKDILLLVKSCFRFICTYIGDIPGATARDCGNYTDMDITAAKSVALRYWSLLTHINDSQMIYPK